MPVKLDTAKFQERVKADKSLPLRLRDLTTVIALKFVDPQVELVLEGGQTKEVRPLSGKAALSFEGPDAWFQGYFAREQKPGYDSLTFGLGQGVSVKGADDKLMHSYFGGFARLIEVVRDTLLGGPQGVPLKEYPFRDTDDAVGRYQYVTANGQEGRMFYEESGSGDIVLLMQHTAGGDGRQYRYILADPEMKKRCRLIAYDLPYHGRSLPPLGVRWWEEDYKPTKEYLMNWIVGFVDALKLDRPIFMGCSVGGHLALDLAAHHKEKFRAFVGLNGWYGRVGKTNAPSDTYRSPGYSADMYASLCLGATAPSAPELLRQEVYWNYRSNAQGIFAGDVDYFSFGHDLNKDGHLINTNRTPVYLLCGEHDPAALDEENGGPAAARNIPGLKYKVMKGLGHFAPTDNPMAFRQELLPVLDEILANAATH